MCTVTFLKTESGFVLTSNRDEKHFRATITPKVYATQSQTLIYPKDELAGGTWIASNTSGRIACLLNGASEAHVKKPTYSKSRGLILLESFEFESHEDFAETINLSGVEPFTLILVDFKNELKITEIQWDENKLHFIPKNSQSPHIWSSSTLYSLEQRKEREKWFMDWISKYRGEEAYNIFNFHTRKHSNNDESDIVMHRNNGIQTVSITQFHIKESDAFLHYIDLQNKEKSTINLTDFKNEKK